MITSAACNSQADYSTIPGDREGQGTDLCPVTSCSLSKIAAGIGFMTHLFDYLFHI